MKAIHKLFFLLLTIAITIAILSLIPHTAAPAAAGDPPCTTRPDNMTRNGSITDGGYNTQYGTVANEWNAFIFQGTPPAFDLADNESANGDISGSSSQYIHADGFQFDAGIYQSISGTQPGAYYEFKIGLTITLRDVGGGKNVRNEEIGRQVGVDPTGGVDPHSPTVIWGPQYWEGGAKYNKPQMDMVFAAQADHVTVFARAFDKSSSASDKAWFDVMCMVPRGDLPTATPAATATPSPAPTNTPRVVAQAANAAPVVTRVPTKTPKPTNTATPLPTNTPTVTNTPTQTAIPTDTPRPRRAIPLAGAAVDSHGDSSSDSAATTNQANMDSTGTVVLVGSVGLIGLSAIGILVLGAFFLIRLVRRPSPPELPYY